MLPVPSGVVWGLRPLTLKYYLKDNFRVIVHSVQVNSLFVTPPPPPRK